MARQALQSPAHVYQILDFVILLIGVPQIRAGLQGLVECHSQISRNHLRNRITFCIRHVQNTAYVTDHALSGQRTEGHNLNHPVFSVFAHDIIDNLLSALKAEVDINIRHRHPLRIQETLKEQLVTDGIDIGDPQAVGHNTACCGTASRPHHNIMGFCKMDKIPYDQEIVHVSHGLNNTQLVFQPLFQRSVIVRIMLIKTVKAELSQIFPRGIPLRHVELGQLCDAEFNIHIAALRYFMGIIQGIGGVWENFPHLFLRLQIKLAPLIPHPVLIRHLLACLDAEQDIMGLDVFFINIMAVVGRRKRDAQLLAHAQQPLVYRLLRRYSVVLKLQEKIALSENFLIAEGRFAGLLIHPSGEITLHLASQAGAQGDDSLTVLPEHFKIHPRLIIKAFDKPFGYNLHQVLVSHIIFRQQD